MTPQSPPGERLNRLIALNCRGARLHKGYSIARLERRTGVPADEIEAMEAGEISVSAIYVYRLAALTGRNVEDFFPREPSPDGVSRPS